ncbi:CheR family methyltransferase [Cesiribacter andamanensis]|uniref:Chemotaxis protein methyltransferase n=1 Tax=Cesiribacter andamanensis AMV16 TaxID=1279009 RepID=M7MZF8_9BACT|nr:protein-glutamate O-methyltransferase CheR [Cesiribacter andamanensis]EMR01803.1 Chemotaxis protein methyltransferase [Cesiribacter andamanensis AMV16]
MKDDQEDLFEQEVEALITAINAHYGYDFSGYARASVYRRIRRFMDNKRLPGIPELQQAVLRDSYFFEGFLQEVTVNVTEMFRDPSFFLSLRQHVLPRLSTYPHIKIWDAGCSTGEELFSLLILLEEEGLLKRTKVYATDINQKVLKEAREGIYPARSIAAYTAGYYAAGGKREFSSYYTSNYGGIKFNSSLLKNVLFYPHNLATDFSFNEFHLIICRNVLIYFTRELQEKVYALFDESLVPLGYLGLGKKETLTLAGISKDFEVIDKSNRIYRKIR